MATKHIVGNGGIIAVIAKSNYSATHEQVEQLAHVVVSGLTAGEVYLRVILAHMQSRLGKPRRGKQHPQEPVLDAVHTEFYPDVLRGVGPEEMGREERNRLATFARSMASTVRLFVRGGGDVRGVDLNTVTKTALRKMVQPPAEAPADETRPQRSMRLASEGVLKAAQRLARGDPEDARQRLEQLMEQFEALLEELGKEPADVGGQTTTVVGTPTFNPIRTRVGQPLLNRGA